LDELVKKLHKKKIKILPVLGTWVSGKPKPPKNKKKFFDYIENVVSRYSGKIKQYEIWNEPNMITFWNSSFNEFSSFLKNTSGFIKNIDDARLGINVAWMVGFGTPWSLRFIKKLSENGSLKNIELIGLHGYPGTWEPGNFDKWKERIETSQKYLSRLKEDLEIWITEFGYYSFKHQFFYPHTPEVQTKFLLKSLQIMQNLGIPVAIWYCLQDPILFSNHWKTQKYTFQEHGFGLFTKKLEAKDPKIVKIVKRLN